MTTQQLGTLLRILIILTGIISAVLMVRGYIKFSKAQYVILPYGIASILHGLFVTMHSLMVGPIPLVSFLIPLFNTCILIYIITRHDYHGFN